MTNTPQLTIVQYGERSIQANRGTQLLRDAGYRIVESPSCEEAFRMASQDRQAVLLPCEKTAERFRILADKAPALMWMTGPDGCEFVNRACLEFVGATESDVQGYNWSAFVHPDDRQAYMTAYLEAVVARRVFEATARLRRHDGQYRWMTSIGTPRFSEEGQYEGYVGATIEVTDLRAKIDERPGVGTALKESIRHLLHRWNIPREVTLVMVSLACAAVLRVALMPLLGYRFITFYPAIVFSTIIGGWGYGVAATVMAAFLSVILFLPLPFDAQQGMALLVFLMVSGMMIVAADSAVRARRRAERETLLAQVREGALRDELTARAQAEAALRETQAQLRRELEGARQLGAVSKASSKGTDEEILYEEMLDTAVAITDSDFASLQIFEEGRGQFRLLGHRGFSPDNVRSWEWVTPSPGTPCGRVMRTRQRLGVPDVHQCEWMAGTPHFPSFRDCGIRAIQTTPLMSRDGRIMGMLSTHWRAPHTLLEAEGRRLDILSRLAADIMEGQQTQKELRRVTADLAEAQRVAKLGSWHFDLATSAVRWSDELFHLFDVEPTAFGGLYESFLQRVHPDDRAKVLQTNAEARAHGRPFAVEYRIVTRSGEVRTIREVGYAETDEMGGVVGLFGTAQDITERQRADEMRREAEEALRESEARFRTLTDTVPSMAFEGDAQGHNTFASQQWCRYTGMTPEETAGTGWAKAVHPDDFQESVRQWTLAMQAEIPCELRHRLRAADGSYRWFLIRAVPRRDVQGRLIYCGSCTDIDDLTRTEAALRESEERLSLALAGGDLAIWDWDFKSGHVSFNERWARMREYEPSEITPHVNSWIDGIHPDDLSVVKDTLDRYLTGQHATYECEMRVRTRSGGWRWILDSGKISARDSEGRPIRMSGTELDITERQRAKDALRESEERFAGIVNLALDAIITVDHDQRIILFNPSAERIFGCTAETVIGTTLDRFIPPRARHVHRAHMEAFAREGRSSRPMDGRGPAELRAIRADGQEFPIEASISVLHRGGNPLYTVILRDITERKQAEAALQQLNASLEQQVTARTASLRESEERFRLAQQAARIGTFALNLQTGENTWTPELEALYGLKPGEFARTQAAWEQFLHPEDRLQATASVTHSLETGEPVESEFRVLWQDGTIRWLLGRWQMFRDSHGTPLRLTGVNLDITSRKKVKEELIQSQARLRALTIELNLTEQRERKRLAAELHDHLQQMLVLGKIQLSQAKRYAGDRPGCVDLVKKVENLLSDCLVYTRTLVADLSPPVLREQGLVAGLQWLGESMQKRNLAVTVVTSGPAEIRLPEDQMVLLFQSVRELLINSWKYAETGQATVTVDQGDAALRIVVSDEGRGFDLAAAETPSGGLSSKFGLFSIQERMRALSGSFDIQSTPGQGTRATLTLPLC